MTDRDITKCNRGTAQVYLILEARLERTEIYVFLIGVLGCARYHAPRAGRACFLLCQATPPPGTPDICIAEAHALQIGGGARAGLPRYIPPPDVFSPALFSPSLRSLPFRLKRVLARIVPDIYRPETFFRPHFSRHRGVPPLPLRPLCRVP